MASIVCVADNLMGAVYRVELLVGTVPLVV